MKKKSFYLQIQLHFTPADLFQAYYHKKVDNLVFTQLRN